MSSAVDVGALTAEDFEPRRNDTFRLRHAGGELPLQLHDVRRLGYGDRRGGAFSLLFVGAPGPFLPQAVYPLVHAAIGTLQLFLVPLGPTPAGNSYEAILA